jgi:hypothetical protein
LTEESAKLEDLTLKLDDLDSARDCNKMWITSLKEQIRLMCGGQGVTSCPVSMDECDAVLFIRPCPVYGKYFQKKAFYVTTCGCMYHPFCLGAHLELFKSSTYAGRMCKEVFGEDMIELFGYHQHRIDLIKPKLERTQLRRRRLTPDSSTSKPCK